MDVDNVIATYHFDSPIRLALRFTGTVQGVGFRWTTQELARQYGVTGWIHNEDDETVTAQMQGTGHAIGQVLIGLRDQFAHARSYSSLLRPLHFSVATCEKIPLRSRDSEDDFSVRI